MSHGQTLHRHDRVLAVVQENAASLLRLARRHSLCADDAQDAYQRALEIYLRRADDVEEATAASWLRTVVKHEAMAIREARQKVLPGEEIDFDAYESAAEDVSDRAVSFDRLTRAAEALQQCKSDEVTALALKTEGHSYNEICRLTGWSYTKVNRVITEGRARFLKTYAAIESGDECEKWTPLLSAIVDGEASPDDMAAVRPHLRNCAGCRATLRELHESQPVLHAVLPAGLVVGAATAEPAAGSLLTRLYEAMMGPFQETAIRLHTVADTVSAPKVAAVAASAAAMAGGGAVAVDRSAQAPAKADPRPVVERRVDVRKPRRPARLVRARPAATATPAPPPAAEPPPKRRRTRPAPPPAPEFSVEEAAPPAQPTSPARKQVQEQPETFGFER